MENIYMTSPEVAKYLKVSPDVIYELVRAERFPAVKIGGQWRIRQDLLDQWYLDKFRGKGEDF